MNKIKNDEIESLWCDRLDEIKSSLVFPIVGFMWESFEATDADAREHLIMKQCEKTVTNLRKQALEKQELHKQAVNSLNHEAEQKLEKLVLHYEQQIEEKKREMKELRQICHNKENECITLRKQNENQSNTINTLHQVVHAYDLRDGEKQNKIKRLKLTLKSRKPRPIAKNVIVIPRNRIDGNVSKRGTDFEADWGEEMGWNSKNT